MIWILISCAAPLESSFEVDTIGLRRISLAIKGTLPTTEEYQRITENPSQINVILEEYISSEWHERRLNGIFADWTKNRVDAFNISQEDYQLPLSTEYNFLQSVGEETPRLMTYYATKDQDWRMVVQSPFTMANDMLLSLWPLEELGTEDETWRKAKYTDGRPPLGILMNNGLWWRYYTTPNNFNRSRASVMAELFLCTDYRTRPISFEATALLEHEDFNDTIQSNEACIGCHNTLDPLAAAFFGFWWYDIYDTAEMSRYHPEREFLGEDLLNINMAYFGIPMSSPAALGNLVAQDPRFTKCTTKRLHQALAHTDKTTFSDEQHLHEVFAQSDFRISALVKEIVQMPGFHTQENRILSAQQLASSIEELTGFVWKKDDVLLLENDIIGYRKMLGGADGLEITSPARQTSISRQLTLKRLTQKAAMYWATEQEINGSLPTSLEDDLYQDLFIRIYGKPVSKDRKELDQSMFTQIQEEYSNTQAWASLLSVWLRDPLFWSL